LANTRPFRSSVNLLCSVLPSTPPIAIEETNASRLAPYQSCARTLHTTLALTEFLRESPQPSSKLNSLGLTPTDETRNSFIAAVPFSHDPDSPVAAAPS